MSRCEKCLMDPCLCNIDGFGPEEEENTTEKDIKELMGRSVIVKITPNGTTLLQKAMTEMNEQYVGNEQFQKTLNEQLENRRTDVIGKIDKIGMAMADKTAVPIFFILYENPISTEFPGHWYFDEELIYI